MKTKWRKLALLAITTLLVSALYWRDSVLGALSPTGVRQLYLNPFHRQPFPPRECPLTLGSLFLTLSTRQPARMRPVLVTWWLEAEKRALVVVGDDANVTSHEEAIRVAGDGVTGLNAEYDRVADDEEPVRWWCRWRDDRYVNLRQLVRLLRDYDWDDLWYIGGSKAGADRTSYRGEPVDFEWASGGGWCVSRRLAQAMAPYAYDRRLGQLASRVGIDDGDKLVGFIVTGILHVKLTRFARFDGNAAATATEQMVSAGSGTFDIDPRRHRSFSLERDPTRFLSLHCLNYPGADVCRSLPPPS